MTEEQAVESAEQVVEETQTEEVTTEETQAETPAEEAAEETAETPPPKPKQTAQERINELTRIRRDSEREAAYWKKVALEKKETPPEPKAEASLPGRPKLEQFETTEQYEDALFEWRDNVREIKSSAQRQEQEYESALKEFNERARKLRIEHEDFDEVIESPVFSPAMREAVLLSENGPQVAYHLGKSENWALAERIRNLTPSRQLYEMGKVETQLLVATQKKTVTSAPAPIKPVGITGTGVEKDPSKMTTAEWFAWDNKKRIANIDKQFGGKT